MLGPDVSAVFADEARSQSALDLTAACLWPKPQFRLLTSRELTA